MDLQLVILLVSAIGSFVTIFAIGMPMLQKDQAAARLKMLAARREELSRQQKQRLEEKNQQRPRLQQKKHVDMTRKILEMFNLREWFLSKDMRVKLMQAGMRSQSAPVTLALIRFLLPALMMGFFLFIASASSKINPSVGAQIAICAVIALFGFYLPRLLISNYIQKRQKVLLKAFPDALDLLIICVEAGLSVEGSFARVAEELGDRSPELAEEFGLTTVEMAFLPDRRAAFENFSERTGLAASRQLATALIQSEKYGTPVSVALRVVSQESRDQRMSAAERKAGALPAQLTVPMIVFFLPVLFIVIIGPAIIQSMNELSK